MILVYYMFRCLASYLTRRIDYILIFLRIQLTAEPLEELLPPTWAWGWKGSQCMLLCKSQVWLCNAVKYCILIISLPWDASQ